MILTEQEGPVMMQTPCFFRSSGTEFLLFRYFGLVAVFLVLVLPSILPVCKIIREGSQRTWNEGY